MQTKPVFLRALLIAIASFIYLMLLSAAYKSSAPCGSTQDFRYPLGRVLSTMAPFLLIGTFYLSFRHQFAAVKRKLLLSALLVLASMITSIIFAAAVYIFIFPSLEKHSSGTVHKLISSYDCMNDVSPSDLLTNFTFATGLLISIRAGIGITNKLLRKRALRKE